MHQRINKIDNKHSNNYSDLKLLVMTFIESQKPLNENMKGIREDFRKINDVLLEYVRKTDKMFDELEEIKEKQANGAKDRNDFLVRVLVAAVGAGGFVPVLIEIFFK
ncbi:hypothetical protein ACS7WQ_06330 [Staphylococcus felis]|uniref:hypothetical protein n=1 Tax=Staphylococcus felis TaxID=46127 RepID=UPI003F431724